MFFVLVAIGIFIVTVFIHILIHRLLRVFNKKNFFTIVLFILGIGVVWGINHYILSSRIITPLVKDTIWLYPFDFTALVLYIFLSFSYVVYIATPYLGDEGPTAKIILSLLKKQSLSEEEIVHSFRDRDVIEKRITDMIGIKWVENNKSTLTLTPRGTLVARTILLGRRIYGFK
jgi:hypothetical protein